MRLQGCEDCVVTDAQKDGAVREDNESVQGHAFNISARRGETADQGFGDFFVNDAGKERRTAIDTRRTLVLQ